MRLTKRTVLDVGWGCNANCKFCYYKHSHKQKFFSTKELRNRLKKSMSYGMESIEFTGGEPALREDIFELIEYAKKLGFKRLGIITNGIIFSDFDFTKRIKKAGLDEIKFSVHGSRSKIHDKIIGVTNGFENLMKGIKNAKKENFSITTSTVICKTNYKDLADISNLLTTIKPRRVNFEIINPIIDAKDLKQNIVASFSEISPHLHKSIDILRSKKLRLTVRYIPFCFMQGYEEHVCDLCQVQYDPDEWDYLIKNRAEYGLLLSNLSQLLGYINMLKRKYIPKKDIAHRAVIESKLLRMTTKSKACKKCKYDFICDGLWKLYTKLYGYDELKPWPGKKITNPTFFIKKP
jgi:MoaA/NifB/PqqE/SkfB family radical SAM enzyme